MGIQKSILLVALVGLATSAQATLLTSLSGVTTSAGSCYTGCGHPQYDHGNIIDGDFGTTGNNGLNSWNSGFWGGYVQINFGSLYQLDRIELHGGSGYFNPYTLYASQDGVSWGSIASGGYHDESALSHVGYLNLKYGAVHDVANNTLGSDVVAQYLRYSVNSGSPHWGYLYELQVDGHVPTSANALGNGTSIPEPASLALLGIGLAGLGASRKRATF